MRCWKSEIEVFEISTRSQLFLPGNGFAWQRRFNIGCHGETSTGLSDVATFDDFFAKFRFRQVL